MAAEVNAEVAATLARRPDLAEIDRRASAGLPVPSRLVLDPYHLARLAAE